MITVRQANLDDIQPLIQLFEAYRAFYRQPPAPEQAEQFLRHRISHNESTVFIAEQQGKLIGFTQLYPSFSSSMMKRVFVLNDLYVDQQHRQNGAAQALLQTAADWAKTQDACRLVLATEHNNAQAQALYEKMGWTEDPFKHYTLLLGDFVS